MTAVGIVMYGDKALDLAGQTVDWLLDRSHDVRLAVDDAVAIGRAELGVPTDSLAAGADLVLSLGGDGTMLRAVRLAAADDVPVLGVNLGQLGYLTEVEPDGIRMALKRFLAGSYSIEERMQLEVVVDRAGQTSESLSALNETVIEKVDVGHTVRLDVELDGKPFTSYVCDGLILATPTGSTAYAFSVRGPIVDPRHRAVLMAPVAPTCSSTARSCCGPTPSCGRPSAVARRAGVSVDGRPGDRLEPGDAVVCTADDRPCGSSRSVRTTSMPSCERSSDCQSAELASSVSSAAGVRGARSTVTYAEIDHAGRSGRSGPRRHRRGPHSVQRRPRRSDGRDRSRQDDGGGGPGTALGRSGRSRPGCGRVAEAAVVEGLFVVGDTEWVLRRVVPAVGRSRSYVNGELVTAGGAGGARGEPDRDPRPARPAVPAAAVGATRRARPFRRHRPERPECRPGRWCAI